MQIAIPMRLRDPLRAKMLAAATSAPLPHVISTLYLF